MLLLPEELFLVLHMAEVGVTHVEIEERPNKKWYICQIRATEENIEDCRFGLKAYRKHERGFASLGSALTYLKNTMPHYNQVLVRYLPGN